MTNTNTTAAAQLKQVYASPEKQVLLYESNPFFAKLKRVQTGGSSYEVPIIYSAGGGRSATASTAITNSAASSMATARFSVTLTRNLAEAVIDGLTVESSKTDKQAFKKVLEASMDATMQGLANDISFSLFRDGAGARGRIISSQVVTAATTITLQTVADAKNFEVGDVIVASTASDGSGIKQTSSADNTATITGIDRSAGTITFDVAVDSFGSNDWAASDYLYVQGDAAAKIRGLAAWLPSSVSATSFYGVNRTLDSDRLGGLRVPGSGASVAETIVAAANSGAEKGAAPDVCYLSFSQFSSLVRELGSQANQTNFKVGNVGFQSIKIHDQLVQSKLFQIETAQMMLFIY